MTPAPHTPAPPRTLAALDGRSVWDALVIGAGPAGSVAALTLARRGHTVLLVDKAPFPRPKVCGGCLSPAALAILDHLGLAHAAASAPLHTLHLAAGRARATLPLASAVIDRATFDARLAAAAIRAGATFLDATSARVTSPGTAHAPASATLTSADGTQRTIHARAILAADGLASTSLAALPAFAPRTARASWFGVGAHTVAPTHHPAGLLTMTSGPRGYVGAVRLPSGHLNIAAALDPAATRSLGGPDATIAAIYTSADLDPPTDLATLTFRGTPTLTRHRPARHARVLTLGDAASYVEPFTGEGIGWAIADAVAIAPHAEALITGDPAACNWPAAHARLAAARQRPCRALAWALKRPALARAAVAVTGAFPAIATPLLRHVARPPYAPAETEGGLPA